MSSLHLGSWLVVQWFKFTFLRVLDFTTRINEIKLNQFFFFFFFRPRYGGYHDLTGVLHKYVRPSDKTLFMGDVNCCLSESLYDVGYRSLVNIDENDAYVRQMSMRSGKTRPEMKFLQMDAGDVNINYSKYLSINNLRNFC